MYSWEVNNCVIEKNYRFQSYEEFSKILNSSPQIRFNIYYEKDNELCFNVWDVDSDWEWRVYIDKEVKLV